MASPRPVFVHGAGGGRGVWALQERRFEGAGVVALPGHPAGEPLDSVEASAEWLAEAMAEAVPPPRALVGHGLGASVALCAAVEHPDLVDGLVLLGAAATLPVGDDAVTRAREDYRAEAERLVRASLAHPSTALLERTIALVVESGQEALEADYAASRTFDAGALLDRVTQPALVVSGGRDAVTPLAATESLARSLPAALMVVVPEAGHLVMLEQPGPVNLLIAGYLARLELTLDEE
jgi:pimeloyl-ACP methyl ester carboxylesterase